MSLFRINPPKIAALKDGDEIVVAGASVLMKVNRKARRISLRLDRAGRRMIAVAPNERKLADAAAFARDRADWIAKQMASVPDANPLQPGDMLTVFGNPVRLERAPGRTRLTAANALHPARLIAPGDGEAWTRAVLRRLKAEAKSQLTLLTAAHCEALGQPLPPVSVMDAKGRWGSCKPAHGRHPAAIRYSWRLALCPPAVADYVCAHEAAHLIEANHGPQFWALVHDLVGDHRPHRDWLKRHGGELHAVGQD